MPLSDHVDHDRRQRSDGRKNDRRSKASVNGNEKARRTGIPAVDVGDSKDSILSPIISHLSALSGLPSLKGFLPPSPTKQPAALVDDSNVRTAIGTGAEGSKAVWQEGDLSDGRGKVPLLLVWSKTYALQIFSVHDNVIPDDPHIHETFPAPEEMFSIPTIRYDDETERSSVSVGHVSSSSNNFEQVLSARLLERTAAWNEHGPLVAFTTITLASRKSSLGLLALAIVSLRTGTAISRIELGTGTAAAVHSATRAIAVAVSHPTPSIHLFDPVTFAPLHPSLPHLPHDPRTSLPVFAISGRLLAFATDEAPRAPGSDGLGTIVTASSSRRTSRTAATDCVGQTSLTTNEQSQQAALISSAVEIGGGVARGVWAGLKMGAKVASKARNTELARSAPTDSSSGGFASVESDVALEVESRSLEESRVLGDMTTTSSPAGGEWIKIVDLFPRLTRDARSAQPSHSNSPRTTSSSSADFRSTPAFETIAHFRLPTSSPHNRLEGVPTQVQTTRRSSDSKAYPISHLSFSSDGTQLLVAPTDGKSFHIVQIQPAGALRSEILSDCKGQVWHIYELRRGHTSAIVSDVRWDKMGRWVGVSTSKGTIHVFPITPSGGPPTAASHAITGVTNSSQMYPLSTTVLPIVRLWPGRHSVDSTLTPEQSPSTVKTTGATFGFLAHRQHPLLRQLLCQDIGIFRSLNGVLEVARISVRAVNQTESPTVPAPMQRRGSALTEMMRSKAFGEQSDLAAQSAIKAKWALPAGDDEFTLLATSGRTQKANGNGKSLTRSLARAEIQTHCTNPRILPSSVYLSHQVDFFAARPIDDYSPLSIIDVEARTHRLVFRHEVEAKSASSIEAKSFDEPLLSALHSVIEPRLSPQLPGLPNGYPYKAKWHSPIPIRSVTAGLGEGVDRMKREYARAQHIRTQRRQSETLANQLSFEEDAVFASGPDRDMEAFAEDDEDNSNSSPSSGVLPTTNTESSLAGDEKSDRDKEEWGEGWEEEYRRAVEDDGGPDDLVLGLMDEEEEERRKWELRQKALARQFAK
ncbi:hypothetical protein IAR55_004506 [Kwoniella newhampshirensis]|uniref:BCAS3 WD40 domain-containing protein n=1 Tax=Kwoniella newhampshirensis TaxID=1651941 RepID=A0AAW0YXW3_9TREE